MTTDALLVSPDGGWATRTCQALAQADVRCDTAEDADDAFAAVYAVAVRVLVLDVGRLEESQAELAELFGAFESSVPILFVAEKPAEGCIARDEHAVVAAVREALEDEGVIRGTVDESQPLSALFARLGADRASGALVMRHLGFVSRLITSEGSVVAYQSSSAEDRVGNVLVARGLATEAQLRESLERQRSTSRRLGEVLAEMIETPAGIERALLEHRRDALVELCLWEAGEWTFHPSKQPLADAGDGIPLRAIADEGEAAQRRWRDLKEAYWLDDTTVLRAGRVAASSARRTAVLGAVGDGKSLETVRLELRWPRLETYEVMAEMIREGSLLATSKQGAPAPRHLTRVPLSGAATMRPSEAPEAWSDERGAEVLDAIERELGGGGDRNDLRARVLEVLALRPTHSRAIRMLARIDTMETTSAQEVGITPEARPKLTQPLAKLTQALTPEAAFVLSRLEPGCTVSDVMCICPLSEHQIYAIFADCLKRGLVELEE